MIFTVVFWLAAGQRALRTVLVAAIPLLAPIMTGGPEAAVQALLALVFAAAASLVTSLVSLPETGNGRSRWVALADRGVRSFAQVLAAALAAASLLSDVAWSAALAQAVVAGTTSVLVGLVDSLPEVPEVQTSPRAVYPIAGRPLPDQGAGPAAGIETGDPGQPRRPGDGPPRPDAVDSSPGA